MLKKLHQYLIHVLEVPRDSSILLTLSGGLDSVVMAHLFSRLRYPVTLAHCNFQLRGEESGLDQEFCRNLANRFEMPYLTNSFDTLEYAEKKKISVQMAARELRYQWFDQLRVSGGYSFIATAHHLDDSIETVFINLIRGCGIAGMQGIAARQDFVIRPLNWATREDILKYALEHQLTWREDSSNQSDYYLRNRIRQQLFPALQHIHPSFRDSMQGNMQRFREENLFIAESLEKIRKSAVSEKAGRIWITDLPDYSDAARIPLLHRLLAPYRFNETQIRDIAACVESGKRFESREWMLVTHTHALVLEQKESSGDQPVDFSGVTEIQAFESPAGCISEENIYWEIRKNEGLLFRDEPHTAWFDLDKLQFPLRIRPWKPGDSIIPFGMRGRKKISDILTDLKMNLLEKERVRVVGSGDQLIWVIGIRSDHRFRVKPETRNVLILRKEINL